MSPLVFWPAVLGLSFFAAGLYTYRNGFFGDSREPLSPAGPRILSYAPLFIAAPLATFSGEHFTVARDLSGLVPKWLPDPLFITYFVGVALVAAALSFVARKCMRWSAAMLALMFALFVLTLYLPSAIRHASTRFFWIFPLREGTYAVGAFSVFVYETRRSGAGVYRKFASVVRLWTALVAVLFGIQNILDPQFSPGVPDNRPTSAWVPLPHLLAYLIGGLLVTFGIVMLFKKAGVVAITSVGVLMTVLTVALFGPDLFLARGASQQVEAINFVADTMLFAGNVFAIARWVQQESQAGIAELAASA